MPLVLRIKFEGSLAVPAFIRKHRDAITEFSNNRKFTPSVQRVSKTGLGGRAINQRSSDERMARGGITSDADALAREFALVVAWNAPQAWYWRIAIFVA